MADLLKDKRMEIAKKAVDPKPRQPFDVNVMEQDPATPGAQRIMISTNPGHWYSEGDPLPGGGSYEASKNRAITYLPGQGEGEPFDIRMGDHAPKAPGASDVADWYKARQYALDEGAGSTFGPIPSSQDRFENYRQQLAEAAQTRRNAVMRNEIEDQIEDANFPDPRTDRAVMDAVEDMLAEQFVGLKLLSTSEEHEDGIPDRIYFEAGDGSHWEWNSNGEIHRADEED